MKIRTVTLAMMTLMLSAGPLMAMDSEHQDRARQGLYQRGDDASIHAQGHVEGDQDRLARQRAHSPRYLLGEPRLEDQAPWWH